MTKPHQRATKSNTDPAFSVPAAALGIFAPPSKRFRHMQATLQNGDAGKELDNLRLLESMGLEVCPQHASGKLLQPHGTCGNFCPAVLKRSDPAGAVLIVKPLHWEAEPEVSGGDQHQAW